MNLGSQAYNKWNENSVLQKKARNIIEAMFEHVKELEEKKALYEEITDVYLQTLRYQKYENVLKLYEKFPIKKIPVKEWQKVQKFFKKDLRFPVFSLLLEREEEINGVYLEMITRAFTYMHDTAHSLAHLKDQQ